MSFTAFPIEHSPLVPVVRVLHGADATVVRPAGAQMVTWVGTVVPNNMVDPDMLIRTDLEASPNLIPIVPGRYYDGSFTVSVGSINSVANRSYANGFIVEDEGGFSIDRIGVMVQTAAASTAVKLGVYAADQSSNLPNGLPLVETAPLDTSTTGFKEQAISLYLPQGLYYLASICNGVVTFRGRASPSAQPIGFNTGASADGVGVLSLIKTDGQSYAAGLTDWGGAVNGVGTCPSVRVRIG